MFLHSNQGFGFKVQFLQEENSQTSFTILNPQQLPLLFTISCQHHHNHHHTWGLHQGSQGSRQGHHLHHLMNRVWQNLWFSFFHVNNLCNVCWVRFTWIIFIIVQSAEMVTRNIDDRRLTQSCFCKMWECMSGFIAT